MNICWINETWLVAWTKLWLFTNSGFETSTIWLVAPTTDFVTRTKILEGFSFPQCRSYFFVVLCFLRNFFLFEIITLFKQFSIRKPHTEEKSVVAPIVSLIQRICLFGQRIEPLALLNKILRRFVISFTQRIMFHWFHLILQYKC